MIERNNPEKKVATIAAIITLVAILIVVFPYVSGADMMNWGYGVSCIAGFFAMAGVITTLVYGWRAKKLQKVFEGQEEILAHWFVSPAVWQKFIEVDYALEKEEKRALWYIISGFCVVIGIGFWIFDPEAGGIVLLVLFGLAALLAFFAFVVPWLYYRSRRNKSAEVWITPTALVINSTFHNWTLLDARLENVSLQEGNPSMIVFDYSYTTRSGRETTSARAPIPPGEEATAQRVIAYFNQSEEG